MKQKQTQTLVRFPLICKSTRQQQAVKQTRFYFSVIGWWPGERQQGVTLEHIIYGLQLCFDRFKKIPTAREEIQYGEDISYLH